MSSRARALTIRLHSIGSGEVVTALPASDLFTPGETRIMGPRSPRALNLRLIKGVAAPRPGYTTYGNHPASLPILGLYQVQFDTLTSEFVMANTTTLYYDVAGVWTSIVSPPFTATAANAWCFAMVRRAGSVSPANQLMCCSGATGDNVYRYRGGGGGGAATVGAAIFNGARVIVGHRGRSLVMNVNDVGLGARKHQRVYYSIVGDPETFAGTGSGFVDLDDDAYPIIAATVISGNVVVFKGNSVGGSIVIGTLTGNVNAPYVWSTINTNNIGLLYPRTLLQLDAGRAFFVGHDGFYLYDGARALQPVSSGIARDVMPRCNTTAYNGGLAWHVLNIGEVYVGVPTGAATSPSEYWIFNSQDKRIYGPLTYPISITSVGTNVISGALTWSTLPLPSWTALPYASWDTIGTSAEGRTFLFGDSSGFTWKDDGQRTTDNGATITTGYYTGEINPGKYRHAVDDRGAQREMQYLDYMVLRDVEITYINNGTWIPLVECSIDAGNTWTAISNAVAVGSATSVGAIMSKIYNSELSGRSFLIRVSGDFNMRLAGMRMEFTYSGSGENE